MKNLRAILMPIAILLGILLPQAHVLSPLMPFLIGTMMFLTFVAKIPPQTHGYTFKIEVRALVVSLILVAAIAGIVLSLESVFGVFFGWLAGFCGWIPVCEVMTPRRLCGYALVFAAIVFTQVLDARRTE